MLFFQLSFFSFQIPSRVLQKTLFCHAHKHNGKQKYREIVFHLKNNIIYLKGNISKILYHTLGTCLPEHFFCSSYTFTVICK